MPRDVVRFAAIVPVGPTPQGLGRGLALIESLLHWEPNLACCIVLDDAEQPRGLSDLSLFPPSCQSVTMSNPLNARAGRGWVGTLSAGILEAMAWIHAKIEADFVLRVDADALVIGPFAEAVHAFLAHTPDAGVVGTVGLSCNPQVRRRQNPLWEPRILRACRLWPTASASHDDRSRTIEIETFGPITNDQRRAFDALRPTVDAARRHGYATHEYCQGGACTISRAMIERMAVAGYLAESPLWAGLPFTDDGVLAMYARAVGLRLYDRSEPGQPFGVQHVGLPYAPDELVARGYALIHSVKNDPDHSEGAIRDFFKRRLKSSAAC